MPGRQSTGPVIQKSSKSKKQIRQRSLNALAIAEQQEPERVRIRRNRLGEIDQYNDKRKREVLQSSSDEDEGDGDIRKKPRTSQKDRFGDQLEGGSDSEGNVWVLGQAEGEDDSDIDSDEAMGESDENRFESFTFGGSSTLQSQRKPEKSQLGTKAGTKVSDDMSLEEGEESDGFKEEAIDLADILDADHDVQSDSCTSEDKGTSRTMDKGSETDYEDSLSDNSSKLSISDAEDEDNDTAKLSALQTLVTLMDDGIDSSVFDRDRRRDGQELSTPSEFGLNPKQKLTVADLMTTVTDPKLRKSLKLLTEDNSRSAKKNSGIPQKLEVPLAKRQQDRLDRAAAYGKSKETLNRWIDTVKHNRRAEHLSFPLRDPEAFAAKGTTRLLPTQQSKPMTNLESAIQSILVDSGLLASNGSSQEEQVQAFEELQTNRLPIEEVQTKRAELRKARELLFREEIRAKRIKKIKSKSYRRVHRRERDRNVQQEREALVAAGLDISEDEQERNDRRRAEERMGARHRESKWTRGVKDTGRAVWDEDARNGVAEMAKREEELRRRIEGRDVNNGDDDDSCSSNTETSDEEEHSNITDDQKTAMKLQNRLRDLDSNSEANPFKQNGRFGLTSMKFMQNAEKNRREQNDLAVEKLSREMTGIDSSDESEAGEPSGRRKYGPTQDSMKSLKSGTLGGQTKLEEEPASNDEVPHLNRSINSNLDIAVSNTEKSKQPIISTERFQERGDANCNITSIAKRPDPKGENPWLSSNTKNASSKEKEARASHSAVLISNFPNSRESTSSVTVEQSSKSEEAPPHTEFPLSPASFSGFSSDSDLDTQVIPSTLPENHNLIRQAFAGDEVVASFEAEKTSAVKEDEDKVIDNTLPGWGSWIGAGISKKEQRRNKGKVLERKEGIKKEKRVDWGLEKVIINEKRVKKVGYS